MLHPHDRNSIIEPQLNNERVQLQFFHNQPLPVMLIFLWLKEPTMEEVAN